MINREDMLELTRRMTPSRHCFDRAAGAYMDEDGFVDGSFNIHFGKLSPQEVSANLKLAKSVPFSGTNRYLKEYAFTGDDKKSREMRLLLSALRECSLKNDALLYSFYEQVGETFDAAGMDGGYAIRIYHGNYDIPRKARDKESLWESEEVYNFLIGIICPLAGEYEPGDPVWGFLYPAFSYRSADPDHIDLFDADPDHPNAVQTLFCG